MSAGAQPTDNGSGDAPPDEAVTQLPAPSGYWLVGTDGGIFSYGEAAFHGSMGGERINEPVVDLAATVTGEGYWEVARDGGIFSFGDAQFHQSMGGKHLNAPMIGIAATPTGGGYWTVATDGGVFSFGDAEFYGSMGGKHLNEPVIGIVPTPTGEGYWLVAEDGGVFNYGDAPFDGSLGGNPPDEPIVGLAASGDGYVTVTADGRIDAFGTTGMGSLPTAELGDRDIVAVANDANSEGFWLAADDGTVYELEGAHHWDDARELPLNGAIVAIASVARDAKAPEVTGDRAGVGATSVTFTANEPLDPATVEVQDVTSDADADITAVVLGGGGATITVTFDDHLALDDTVTLAAGSVTDLAGNAGPADDVVVTVADLTPPTIEALGVEEIDGGGFDQAGFESDEPLHPASVSVEGVTTDSEATITGVALFEGGTVIVVSFDGLLADGDTVTLLAGSVTDLAGNAGPEADVVATAPDRTGPTVTAGVVEGDTVTFVADEPLDPDEVGIGDATTSLGDIVDVELEDDGTTITVTFDEAVADGTIVTLLAGSVSDLAGNTGPAADVPVTAPDRTGPTVAVGTIGVDSVTFTANEPLNPTSVSPEAIEASSETEFTAVAEGSTITVTFAADLAEGDTVTLLAGSVTDVAGNPGPPEAVVATVPAADAAPFIVSATAIDNGDGDVSPADGVVFLENDEWTIVFSEPVSRVPTENARFILSDGATTGVFVCNSTGCTLGADERTLTVNVLGLPVSEESIPLEDWVPVAGIGYPATITGFAGGLGPQDLAGNPVYLGPSGVDIVELSEGDDGGGIPGGGEEP